MSIVRMRKVFRKRVKAKIGKRHVDLPSLAEAVFYVIIIIFVAGAYYTFGGPSGRSRSEQGRGGRASAVVAVVNGEKIPRALFDLNLSSRQDMGQSDATQERWTKSGLLNSLIDSVLMRQATKREHIKVTGADIRKKIDDEVEQTVNTRFSDKRALKRHLKKQNQTLDQFKAELRREIGKDTDRVKQQVAEDKLKETVEKRVALTDDELKDSYTEVKASHILIKPDEEAKRAKPAAGQQQADGAALAKQKADALLAQVKQGADFAKLAKENSQDPGSAVKGGDLGWFKRGAMVKEFDEVAFKLQPGQVSEVFKSPFGYHFMKVFERRTNLPKDFEKNKATYREQVLSERKYKAWSEYQDELKKQAQIQIVDPELQAYSLLDEAQKSGAPDKAKQAQAKALLEEATKQDPQNVTALWELAGLCEQEGNKQRAAETLDAAIQTEEGARSPSMHMKLGDLYMELAKQADAAQQAGLRQKAVDQYKDTFDRASAFTQMNYFMNMQVEQKLKPLNQPELAKQIAQWLTDYQAEQAKNPQGGMGGFGPMGGAMPFTIPSQ